MQATDPPAVTTSWTRTDRELTNLAIWLPTVTPNELDLVSRRAGNYRYNPRIGVLLDQLWVRQLARLKTRCTSTVSQVRAVRKQNGRSFGVVDQTACWCTAEP
jgi:hypothetical protein